MGNAGSVISNLELLSRCLYAAGGIFAIAALVLFFRFHIVKAAAIASDPDGTKRREKADKARKKMYDMAPKHTGETGSMHSLKITGALDGMSGSLARDDVPEGEDGTGLLKTAPGASGELAKNEGMPPEGEEETGLLMDRDGTGAAGHASGQEGLISGGRQDEAEAAGVASGTPYFSFGEGAGTAVGDNAVYTTENDGYQENGPGDSGPVFADREETAMAGGDGRPEGQDPTGPGGGMEDAGGTVDGTTLLSVKHGDGPFFRIVKKIIFVEGREVQNYGEEKRT